MNFLSFNLFVCFQCVCTGILVGAGMQKIGALSNLVSYYCIGLPIGIALMFAAKLRTLGNAFTFSADQKFSKPAIPVILHHPVLDWDPSFSCLKMFTTPAIGNRFFFLSIWHLKTSLPLVSSCLNRWLWCTSCHNLKSSGVVKIVNLISNLCS